jgi:GxxExxY protein
MNVQSFPNLGSDLTSKIISCAINVHRQLGAGLLESIYEECFLIELEEAKINFESQKTIPLIYNKKQLKSSFRLDLLIENKVIVELKAVDKLLPIHQSQIMTYMKLSRTELGLIINFNEVLLKNGIKRVALSSHD